MQGGKYLIVLALPLLLQIAANSQSDGPPHDYADPGSHFIVALGFGATTGFRDAMLKKSASAVFVGTASGFVTVKYAGSVSG